MNIGKGKRVMLVLTRKRSNGGDDGMGGAVKTGRLNKNRTAWGSNKPKYRCRKQSQFVVNTAIKISLPGSSSVFQKEVNNVFPMCSIKLLPSISPLQRQFGFPESD